MYKAIKTAYRNWQLRRLQVRVNSLWLEAEALEEQCQEQIEKADRLTFRQRQILSQNRADASQIMDRMTGKAWQIEKTQHRLAVGRVAMP